MKEEEEEKNPFKTPHEGVSYELKFHYFVATTNGRDCRKKTHTHTIVSPLILCYEFHALNFIIISKFESFSVLFAGVSHSRIVAIIKQNTKQKKKKQKNNIHRKRITCKMDIVTLSPMSLSFNNNISDSIWSLLISKHQRFSFEAFFAFGSFVFGSVHHNLLIMLLSSLTHTHTYSPICCCFSFPIHSDPEYRFY